MIIKLTSDLFAIDPAIRFAEEYQVTDDIYRELWKRYNFLDYSIPELCEVFYIKVGKPIKRRKMDDWIFKGKVYSISLEKKKLGAKAVTSEIFGDLEERVINEITRHMKYDGTLTSHSIA